VVDRRFLDEAHRRDIAVHVWTIDDPAEVTRFSTSEPTES